MISNLKKVTSSQDNVAKELKTLQAGTQAKLTPKLSSMGGTPKQRATASQASQTQAHRTDPPTQTSNRPK